MYRTSDLIFAIKCLRSLQKNPYQKWVAYSSVRTLHQNVRSAAFKNMYPEIVQDLLPNDSPTYELNDHLQKVIQYNILNRNYYFIFSVLTVYKMLAPLEHQTSDNLRLANILDWCIEMGGTACGLADDLLDGSEFRWNQRCWYKTDSGKDAVNDICLLHSGVFKLIHKHFYNQRYCDKLLHIFSKFSFNFCLGQTLDNSRSKVFKENKDISLFTMDKYLACAYYKAVDGVYNLPVHAAMLLANISCEPINDVLEKLGYLFQMQNDTKDCFGSISKYGKEGTDIREGKLTWLIAKALQISNRPQLKMLENNYGRDNIECVNNVVNIYEELNMLQQYKICGQALIENIKNHINKIPHEGFQKVFHLCIDTHVKNDNDILGI